MIEKLHHRLPNYHCHNYHWDDSIRGDLDVLSGCMGRLGRPPDVHACHLCLSFASCKPASARSPFLPLNSIGTTKPDACITCQVAHIMLDWDWDSGVSWLHQEECADTSGISESVQARR